MELIITPRTLLILRFAFLYYAARELYLTQFKNKYNKLIWFMIIFVFGYFGYAIYIAFKRKLVTKRKFQPKFNPR